MIVAVPAATPFTIPEPAPAVATDPLLLLQVPPETASANVTADPTHTGADPVTAANGLTVTTVVLAQPVPSVYVINGLPAAIPLIIPVEPIVANVPSLVLQVPPAVASLSDVVRPTHTLAVPLITAGIALTVAVAVILQPVPAT